MPSSVIQTIKENLDEVDVILNHLSDPNNLGGCDGEHVRAILAKSAREKTIEAQELIEKLPSA